MFKEIPVDELSLSRRGLVCGVGINDADYKVLPRMEGKQVCCPYYQKWVSMIKRCYSQKVLSKQPAYQGCSVSDEWLIFSNFKSWMMMQQWHGMELDKDLLIKGNKVYSDITCLFISKDANTLISCFNRKSKSNVTGAYKNISTGKYKSEYQNPLTKKTEYLGYFKTAKEANIAYINKKIYSVRLFIENDNKNTELVKSAILRWFDA